VGTVHPYREAFLKRENRFASARRKIVRAQFHLRELLEQSERYWETRHSIKLSIHCDKFGCQLLLATGEPDDYVAGPLGDAIHNLRSALDHLIIELIEINGGTPNRNSGFPTGTNAKNFLNAVESKTEGAHPTAIAMLATLEHDATSHGLLRELHRLDIIDKHKTILTSGAVHSIEKASVRYKNKYIALPKIVITERGASRRFSIDVPDHEKITLAKTFHATKSIVFRPGQPLGGEPIIPVVMRMLKRVEQVVEEFDNWLGLQMDVR